MSCVPQKVPQYMPEKRSTALYFLGTYKMSAYSLSKQNTDDSASLDGYG